MEKFVKFISFVLVSFFLVTIAHAGKFETVFGRQADVSSLEDLVVMNDLSQIVAEMEKQGVRIYKVIEREENLKKHTEQKTKHFSFLPTIPKNLEKQLSSYAEETQDGSAYFLSWNEIGSEEDGNIILLSEFSLPTTLFHEYTHHLFEINNRQDTLKYTEQQNLHNEDSRIFEFRAAKVLFDRSLLLNSLWRRDIDNAIKDYLNLAHAVQARNVSEEIAVESNLLELMTKKKSPWFDFKRAEDGVYRYSQGLVNMSKGMNESIISLMDVVKTDGEEMDKSTTQEEKTAREKLYSPMRLKIHSYVETEVALMQAAVDKAKQYLQDLKSGLD